MAARHNSNEEKRRLGLELKDVIAGIIERQYDIEVSPAQLSLARATNYFTFTNEEPGKPINRENNASSSKEVIAKTKSKRKAKYTFGAASANYNTYAELFSKYSTNGHWNWPIGQLRQMAELFTSGHLTVDVEIVPEDNMTAASKDAGGSGADTAKDDANGTKASASEVSSKDTTKKRRRIGADRVMAEEVFSRSATATKKEEEREGTVLDSIAMGRRLRNSGALPERIQIVGGDSNKKPRIGNADKDKGVATKDTTVDKLDQAVKGKEASKEELDLSVSSASPQKPPATYAGGPQQRPAQQLVHTDHEHQVPVHNPAPALQQLVPVHNPAPARQQLVPFPQHVLAPPVALSQNVGPAQSLPMTSHQGVPQPQLAPDDIAGRLERIHRERQITKDEAIELLNAMEEALDRQSARIARIRAAALAGAYQ